MDRKLFTFRSVRLSVGPTSTSLRQLLKHVEVVGEVDDGKRDGEDEDKQVHAKDGQGAWARAVEGLDSSI